MRSLKLFAMTLTIASLFVSVAGASNPFPDCYPCNAKVAAVAK